MTPREWQKSALALWEVHQRGVVSVVTGGGKTTFAFLCMLNFRIKYPNGRFVIIVPTTALLDQWYVSLREDLAVPDEEIACFSGEEKPERAKVVNLLVLNTARTIAPSLASQTTTCLIVDECHRAGSPINALALQGDHQAVLGLSATPERDYDDGFERYILPTLGGVIYSYGYADAHADGVISPFQLTNVRVDLLPHEQTEYDRLSRAIALEVRKAEESEKSRERLRRLMQRRAAVSALGMMRVPVAVKLAEQHRGQRSIIFHERIDRADAIQQVLSQRKHRVTTYHSGIGPIVRRDNLRLYRYGMFDILVTCRALDEGLNVPETTVAIVASSTASARQRIQRLGRVLRPSAGKEMARIYTIYATDQEERRLLVEAQSLEGVASVTWQRGSR